LTENLESFSFPIDDRFIFFHTDNNKT